MVKAIKDQIKTQTRRRIFKNDPVFDKPDFEFAGFTDGRKLAHFKVKGTLTNACGENPKYQPGDIIYVRETFRLYGWDSIEGRVSLQYKDGEVLDFYPDVIDEWLERKIEKLLTKGYLKEDPEDDEKLRLIEDKKLWEPSIFLPKWGSRLFLECLEVRVERVQDASLEDIYAEVYWASLWSKINGRESWNDNPWVWVYDFKKVERPKNFLS